MPNSPDNPTLPSAANASSGPEIELSATRGLQFDSVIELLPGSVVDQIAAGEVVERPAHMIKELVENALDAGATSIEIEFDHGGRQVRVSDNGKGIRKSELALALARHATSKIRNSTDIWNLSSYGFRGEALASIGAVSRLSLQSRTSGEELAYEVTSVFGQLGDVRPAPGNRGTTIIVEDLFGNVPARLKFLKSEGAETAQIRATLKAIALANWGVEFRLKSRGQIENVWPKVNSFLERAKQILMVKKLYWSRYEFEGYRAEAVFASPHEVAGNARSIHLFVQQRWIQDRGLQMAITDAFRGLLMHGEYPIVVASLSVPPDQVDVNIHPTKSQVKFQNPSTAFRCLNRCLRHELEKAPWLEAGLAGVVGRGAAGEEKGAGQAGSVGETREVGEPREPREAGGVGREIERGSRPFRASDFTKTYDVKPTGFASEDHPEFNQVQLRSKQGPEALSESRNGVVEAELRPETRAASAAGPWSRLHVIGQFDLTYIVAQSEDKLVLVDQHAAHERVVYERLMRARLSGSAATQELLLPIPVVFEQDNAQAVMSHSEELTRIGLVIDQSGPSSVVIRALPPDLGEGAVVSALKKFARELHEFGGSFSLEKEIAEICASMACHSVVRAGQSMSLGEMKSLLVDMDEFALSSFCPHGRPVSIEWTTQKVEREFGRIK